jgi:hypothetical protein
MRSKILAAVSAVAIALGMVAFTATSASAHDNSIKATVSCNTDTYQWEVTWKVTNSESKWTETILSSNLTDVVPVGTTLDKSETKTFVQTVTAPTAITLTLGAKWSDNYSTTNSGSISKSSFKGDCTPPPTKVSGNATAVNEVCTDGVLTKGYIQVAITEGVIYTITKKGSSTAIPFDATTGKTAGLDAGQYVVTATAAPGYKLEKPKEWKLTITSAGTCAPPPCLPKSAVSYTYSSSTNSGIITVKAMDGYSSKLCSPFWVTAASWTFDGNTMWPQTLDKWNPANSGNKIDSVGTYPYGADVGCGQGDIYATFTSPGVPYPTAGLLTGPNTPYIEKFLHGMGFSGPNPTYTVRDAGSCNPVAAGVTFQGYQCNVFGPLVLTGTHVTFTVKYDDASPATSVSGVAPGSYELLADFAAQTGDRYFGQVTVTVQADPGYTLLSVGTPVPLTADTRVPTIVKAAPTMQTTWVLDANEPQDCPTVITTVPEVTFTDVCGTANDTVNTTQTEGVTYTVDDQRTNGVGTVTVTATAADGYVFADTVTKTQWSFDFTDVACTEVQPLTPGAFDPTCPEEPDAQSGYIQLDLKAGLHYFIDGVETTSAKNERDPGTYTISVTVDEGYQLVGPSSWQLVVNEPFCPPTLALLSTTASMSQLTCSSGGSYTLANTEGIQWFVDGSSTPTPAGTYPVTTAKTVNVVAQLIDDVNDGWEDGAQTQWTFDFTLPVDCIPTLAFTGSSGSNLGLLLAGGLLVFGGAIIALERRFRTSAR